MNTVQISETVQGWIAEMELPTRADLKIERQSDETEDDDLLSAGEAYRLYLIRDYGLIFDIPKQEIHHDDFCTIEGDDAISWAFESADYRRLHPFNYEAWQVRKLYERAMDLGQTYSCISHEEGKRNTLKRFIEFASGYPQHKVKLYAIWTEHAYEGLEAVA